DEYKSGNLDSLVWKRHPLRVPYTVILNSNAVATMSELTLVSAPSQNGRSEEITNIFPAHVGIKKSARKLKLLADFSGAG
ncbi:hypothetical protein, partial [Corynebacterium stationis]|uniref:hypothetical protein n=1 Tax=Corynebacterium stationis TaxID=1705 RepID=UPI002430FF6F